MKFQNKHTGTVVEPSSDMLKEFYQRNPNYKPVEDAGVKQDSAKASEPTKKPKKKGD